MVRLTCSSAPNSRDILSKYCQNLLTLACGQLARISAEHSAAFMTCQPGNKSKCFDYIASPMWPLEAPAFVAHLACHINSRPDKQMCRAFASQCWASVPCLLTVTNRDTQYCCEPSSTHTHIQVGQKIKILQLQVSELPTACLWSA